MTPQFDTSCSRGPSNLFKRSRAFWLCCSVLLLVGDLNSTRADEAVQGGYVVKIGGSSYAIPRDDLTLSVTDAAWFMTIYCPVEKTLDFKSHSRNCTAPIQVEIGIHSGGTDRPLIASRSHVDKRYAKYRKDRFEYNVEYSKNNPSLIKLYGYGTNNGIYFWCDVYNQERLIGVCIDEFTSSTGAYVAFHFPYQLYGNLPGIETSISNLLERTRIQRGK